MSPATNSMTLIKSPSSRIIYLCLFSACTLLMAVALYMEHVMALEPCPLCIMQRVMVIVVGAIALLATLHGPTKMGIQIYGGLVVAAALGGCFSASLLRGESPAAHAGIGGRRLSWAPRSTEPVLGMRAQHAS